MTKQISRQAGALCLMAGLTILPPVLKAGGTFSPPVVVSTGNGNTQATAAVDAAGNSVVLWENGSGQVSSASHPLQGPWSAPGLLSGTFPYYPQVKTAAAGSATAVWEDYTASGIVSSDRSTNGTWSKPVLVVPGVYNVLPAIQFVMNSQGDAAILWPSQGIVQSKNAPPTQIYAIRRSAGQAWESQQIVAKSTWAAFDNAVLAENGDLIVAWHTYGLTCGRYRCSEANAALHVSREIKGSLSWQDSGSLGAVAPVSAEINVAADSLGRAAVVYPITNTGMVSIVEQGAGQPWSAPVVISSGSVLWSDVACDAAGDLTVAFAIGSEVSVSLGNITANTWTAPATVSGTDYVYGTQFGFAVSSSGAAVLSWTVATPPNVGPQEVRAISRPSAMGSWTAPQSISTGFLPQGASIDDAAVNASGNGVVVYDAVDATGTVRSIFASTF